MKNGLLDYITQLSSPINESVRFHLPETQHFVSNYIVHHTNIHARVRTRLHAIKNTNKKSDLIKVNLKIHKI